MSSRLTCRAQVWVRSFVPKLKNSAVWAISSAVSAPRGIFDHGADGVGDLHLLSPSAPAAATLVDDFDLEVELLLEADERDHDLRASP
jgi:hypothetical protein